MDQADHLAWVRAWDDLLSQARARDPIAILFLVNTLAAGTRLIPELSQDEATLKILRDIARHRESWPVLKSPHPGIDTDHEKLYKFLQLGEDLWFPLDKYAKFKRDRLGNLVIDLWCSVIETGRLWRYFHDDPFWPPQMIVPLPKYAQRASKLLTFTADNLKEWQWCVDREFDHRFKYTDFHRLARDLWGVRVAKRDHQPSRIKTKIGLKLESLLRP